MSDTSIETTAQEAEFSEISHHPERLPILPGEVRPHPTPKQYVVIAVILVVVTAIEIAISYLGDNVSTNLIIVILLTLAFVKFFMVTSWYMHLRTDKRIFSNIFVVGVVAAIVLYAVVLTSLYAFISLRS